MEVGNQSATAIASKPGARGPKHSALCARPCLPGHHPAGVRAGAHPGAGAGGNDLGGAWRRERPAGAQGAGQARSLTLAVPSLHPLGHSRASHPSMPRLLLSSVAGRCPGTPGLAQAVCGCAQLRGQALGACDTTMPPCLVHVPSHPSVGGRKTSAAPRPLDVSPTLTPHLTPAPPAYPPPQPLSPNPRSLSMPT